MKSIVSVLFICLVASTLVGCSGNTRIQCRNTVIEKYPDAEISTTINSNYEFIIRLPNGEVRLVRTMNLTNNDISDDTLIFKAFE